MAFSPFLWLPPAADWSKPPGGLVVMWLAKTTGFSL